HPIAIVGRLDSVRVVRFVLEQLIETLETVRIVYLYSEYLPPMLLMTPDGQVDLMKHEIYYWVNKESQVDLLLYTGDAQPILPEGAFRLSEAVIDLAQKFGINLIVTVGAFITGRIVDK